MGATTRLVHGDALVRPTAPVAPPIMQTATFATDSAERFAEVATERLGHAFYTRYGNPNHAQVAALVADLEGVAAAMVTASGMGALTTAVVSLVRAGDHVVLQRSTYGGTASLLLNLLPRLGVTSTQVEQGDLDAFERAFNPATKLVLLESPSNPKLEITDLSAVAGLAKAHGALTVADNTFATPLNQRPIAFGIDLVWHSATKYLGGHSDVSAGVIAGSAELLERIWDTALLIGAVLGPFDAWLLLRGLRTLALRVERHNANGMALARAAADHPAVLRVHYPGLPTHPQHALAAEQMTGFGGVFALELHGGFRAADRFIASLQLAKRAPSLGSVESLVVHPAAMWGGMLAADQIAGAGIDAGLVRFSAGIEDTEDLIADVINALDSAS
jgi:methionine-gamma-lyase